MKTKIKFNNVSFHYDNSKPILNNISFDIQQGHKIALVGINGSGKSTIAKLINGILTPDFGTIEIDDQNINEKQSSNFHDKIGTVFQNPDDQMFGNTVEENVAFGLENRNVSYAQMHLLVNDILKETGLYSLRKTSVNTLSGGQKQKVAIASAVVNIPSILILDEATSMLDPQAKHELKDLVDKIQQKYNLTIIFISHDIKVIEDVDNVIAISENKIKYNGRPRELFKKHKLINEFGLDAPFSEVISEMLKENGIQTPNKYLNNKELVKWISKLI